MTADTRAPKHYAVELPLRSALERLDPETHFVCGYHLGFWDADGAPSHDTGKGVRPTLALLSAEAAGAGEEVGVPAAIACELIHNFSLLHDDVMDRDVERRHRTTAWARFGIPAAILAGDAMSSLACEVLAEAPSKTTSWAVRCLTACTRRLIAGQSADLAFEGRDTVTLEECLQMAADKTGALMACSASLGAVLADAPPGLAIGLAEYGEHVGLAFQLNDDLLGIWGNPARTGKPVLSDLRSRKKSVPVVYALRSGTRAGERLQQIYAVAGELSEDQLLTAADLVTAAGGRSWTQRRMEQELETALVLIAELSMPAEVADQFAAIATQLGNRDH